MEEETKEIIDLKKVSIKTILNHGYNKASLFDEEARGKIAKLVLDTYDTDKTSRQEKEQRWEDIRDILNDKKQRDVSEEGANIIYPLIKQACKQWATEAYPLIFQSGEVVKATTLGKDDGEVATNPQTGEDLIQPDGTPAFTILPGAKVDKAARRVEFDNFVFTKKVKDYEKNMDAMLSRLAAYGTYFKKVYFDPQEKVIKADIIFPQNVVVNNASCDNEYTVYSHEQPLYVNDIEQRKSTGVFLDIDLSLEEEVENNIQNNTDEFSNYSEAPQLFIEQYRWLDLDKDGFYEPYICVVHKNSQKLVCIVARYTEDDIERKDKKVVRIKPREFFVKYDFIPNNDGNFYSDGFGDLLFHSNDVIDTLLNQLVDAGTLANSSQGFVSKALKQRAVDIKLKPGEFKFVDTMGINPKEAIMTIDHKEPSVILFELMKFLLDSSKALVGHNPAFSQDINPNLAPTTMMAFVQEGAKEFKALFKRVYRSLTKEINMVEDIIRDNKEVFEPIYNEVLDDEKANFEEDYNNKTYDIIPVADVDVTTSFEKSQKSMFLLNLTGNQILLPYLDVEAILRRVLIYANCKDISSIIKTPPPAQPDPALELKRMELELKAKQIESEVAVKAEKEKNELLRIQIATLDQRIKMAEGATKAFQADYEKALKESEVEKNKTSAVLNLANANKANAEAGQSTDDSIAKAENIYEPK